MTWTRRKTIEPTFEDIKKYQDRLWSKIEIVGDCWIWQGAVTKRGNYGMFTPSSHFYGKRAHRCAYRLANNIDDIDDWVVCHSCDNTRCINPKHLFLGTVQDNNLDRTLKNRGYKGVTSKYIGIWFRPDNNKWRAVVYQDNKKLHIGSFETEKEAVLARNKYIDDNQIIAFKNIYDE